jgi:pimeloyl-ACP methyl ester carboxylesterase
MTDFLRMPPEEIPDLLFNGQTSDYLEFLPDPHDLDAAIAGYLEVATFARLAWNPRYDYKLEGRLARIGCPALVIEPDEDRLIPNAQAKRWAELLPDARLRQVSGSRGPTGHGLIIQEPDRAAETIVGFIGEVER